MKTMNSVVLKKAFVSVPRRAVTRVDCATATTPLVFGSSVRCTEPGTEPGVLVVVDLVLLVDWLSEWMPGVELKLTACQELRPPAWN